jgi:hypothetical protein
VEVKVNVLERNVTVMIVILGNCVTQNVMAMETVSMEYVVVQTIGRKINVPDQVVLQ